jgi:hypothetical protein
MTLVSCGQGLTRENLVTSFVENNPEASTEQARCVVDRLIDDYELARLELELSAETPAPAFEEAQFRAMFVCGIEGDVDEQIVDQLIANGVSSDDAPCVSARLVDELTDDDIDVLLSGQITDEFYAKFFDAMGACGAID